MTIERSAAGAGAWTAVCTDSSFAVQLRAGHDGARRRQLRPARRRPRRGGQQPGPRTIVSARIVDNNGPDRHAGGARPRDVRGVDRPERDRGRPRHRASPRFASSGRRPTRTRGRRSARTRAAPYGCSLDTEDARRRPLRLPRGRAGPSPATARSAPCEPDVQVDNAAPIGGRGHGARLAAARRRHADGDGRRPGLRRRDRHPAALACRRSARSPTSARRPPTRSRARSSRRPGPHPTAATTCAPSPSTPPATARPPRS